MTAKSNKIEHNLIIGAKYIVVLNAFSGHSADNTVFTAHGPNSTVLTVPVRAIFKLAPP